MTDTSTGTGTGAKLSSEASEASEDSEAFAARCHEFLTAHAKPGQRRDIPAAKRFQGKLAEAGLAGLTVATTR